MAKTGKPINLKKGGLIWSIWNFVEALALIALGVISIINSSFQSWLFLILSIVIMADGSFKIITNFLPVITCVKADHETKELYRKNISYDFAIFGSVELALGIVLCLNYSSIFNTIKDILISAAAMMLIVAGAALIIFAVGFIISKFYKLHLPIFEIILGAVLLALGIIILVLGKGTLTQIFFFIIGLALVVMGITQIVTTIRVISKQRTKKSDSKKEKRDAIEAEVVDKKKDSSSKK